MVADAFTAQMQSEGEKLRQAKAEIEHILAQGGDLTDAIKNMEASNEAYKKASVAIRKHTTVPKAKAKAKIEP